MKKLNSLICALLLLCACAETKKKAPIVEYVDSLVSEYPNYRSNELAEKSMYESLKNRKKSVTDLSGVEFRFVKLIENPQTGGYSALFESKNCTSDIESNAGGGKYIISDLCILVLGSVSNETAAKLNDGASYSINGVLKDWDEKDVFNLHYSRMNRGIYLGTYILDDMTIKSVTE